MMEPKAQRPLKPRALSENPDRCEIDGGFFRSSDFMAIGTILSGWQPSDSCRVVLEDAIAAIFEEKHRLLDSELVWACALQLSTATHTDTLDIDWGPCLIHSRALKVGKMYQIS